MESVIFCVSITMDAQQKGRAHYPRYETDTRQIGVATSLESAEDIIRSYIASGLIHDITDVHHFTIREVESDMVFCAGEYNSIRIYDRNGDLVERTMAKYRHDILDRFTGRNPEDIRFHEGDIVEVFDGRDRISLAFVTAVPPSEQKAATCTMDASDDCYTVLNQEDYAYDDHVLSIGIFKPQYPIHPKLEEKLRNAYRDSVTFEMRQQICRTTAVAALRNIAEELGATCEIRPYYHIYIEVFFHNFPGQKPDMALCVSSKEAYKHIDRVRVALLRLAGRHVFGRGSKISKAREGTSYDYCI